MPWTEKQRHIFLMAARAAGWNEDQRYIAMRHCGCQLKAGTPSVTHRANDQAAFERCMALAEAHAGQQGTTVPKPGKYRSWREAEVHQGDRLRDLAVRIANEAERLLPRRFPSAITVPPTQPHVSDNDAQGLSPLLIETVSHVCGNDDRECLSLDGSPCFETLDAGQLYRVVESLKAHVGRVLGEHGIKPRTFTCPASARGRLRKDNP